jgi:hypothetical protein
MADPIKRLTHEDAIFAPCQQAGLPVPGRRCALTKALRIWWHDPN